MAGAVGIDVHKDELTVAVHDGPRWTVPRTPAGLGRLATRLVALTPDVVIVEPSGGYERAVLNALHAHTVPVALVNAKRVRAWIEHALGIRAKTDPLDATLLARYGATADVRRTAPPSPAQQDLADLVALRRTLRDDLVAKRHQLAEQPETVAAVYRRVIAMLETELAAVTARIDVLVTTAPEWARTRVILASCPGVGDRTVALLLAELPELGQRDAKALAALVGVAPFTQQSGRRVPTATIGGGRRQVRSDLWLPTLTAMRCNPVIRAFAERLRDQGKPPSVVVVACMHKLLTILNAMVRDDTTWQERPMAA